MKVYLARHGQTDWNVAGKIQGISDIPLNETGIRQANDLAEKIAGMDIRLCRVYTSSLGRAKTTALAVSKRLGISCIVREGLEETHLGDWEGLTWKEIRETSPESFGVWFENRRYTKVPHGESYQDTMERMIPVLKEIVKKEQESGDVLVVTHGGCIMALLSLIHQKPFEDMLKNFAPDNAQLVELDSDVILGL